MGLCRLKSVQTDGVPRSILAVNAALVYPRIPVPTQGWRCKFTIGAVYSTDFVYTAGTADTFTGSVVEAGVLQLVTAADIITIEDGVEVLGDFMEFWSDGTSTFTFGVTSTAASVTPSG